MNRHEYRIKIIFTIYQSILLKKDLETCFKDNFEDDDNEFLLAIENDLLLHEEDYISEITTHLRRWSFDRLNYIDQAILIEAYSEIKSGLNNKNIVIDEAIRIAKEYSNEDSYKYINGVLDNL